MDSASRRAKILDAAVEEFAHTGLHGTTTRAIAASAGVTQPYLYALFPSKRELFIEACELAARRTGCCPGARPVARLLLQLLTAFGDDEVRARTSGLVLQLASNVGERRGIGDAEAFQFIAMVLYADVIGTLGLDHSVFCASIGQDAPAASGGAHSGPLPLPCAAAINEEVFNAHQ